MRSRGFTANLIPVLYFVFVIMVIAGFLMSFPNWEHIFFYCWGMSFFVLIGNLPVNNTTWDIKKRRKSFRRVW